MYKDYLEDNRKNKELFTSGRLKLNIFKVRTCVS